LAFAILLSTYGKKRNSKSDERAQTDPSSIWLSLRQAGCDTPITLLRLP
jgi:hypothetical protein